VAKFCQTACSILVHGGFFFVGCGILASEPWVWPSTRWWQGRAGPDGAILRAEHALSAAARLFYIAYAGRYVSSIVNFFFEVKKSDAAASFAHHVVTVLLIVMSWSYTFVRVGCVIMVLLDSSDLLLQAAKLCKYLSQKKKDMFDVMGDVIFALFAVAWITLKNLAYFYVVWSAYVESKEYFEHGAPEVTCKALLTILGGLLLFWTSHLIAALKKLAVGELKDTRSPPVVKSTPEPKETKKSKSLASIPGRFFQSLVRASYEQAGKDKQQ